MAVGNTGILKYFRPVRSSSSLTTPTLPDPDGPLSERVPAKAIELANTVVKQSKESSRGHCSLHYKGKLCKNPWCKKSEAKSEAPVNSIFCMRLKGVISGRGQGLLRFAHFVDTAIYNHVQTIKQKQW